MEKINKKTPRLGVFPFEKNNGRGDMEEAFKIMCGMEKWIRFFPLSHSVRNSGSILKLNMSRYRINERKHCSV